MTHPIVWTALFFGVMGFVFGCTTQHQLRRLENRTKALEETVTRLSSSG